MLICKARLFGMVLYHPNRSVRQGSGQLAFDRNMVMVLGFGFVAPDLTV